MTALYVPAGRKVIMYRRRLSRRVASLGALSWRTVASRVCSSSIENVPDRWGVTSRLESYTPSVCLWVVVCTGGRAYSWCPAVTPPAVDIDIVPATSLSACPTVYSHTHTHTRPPAPCCWNRALPVLCGSVSKPRRRPNIGESVDPALSLTTERRIYVCVCVCMFYHCTINCSPPLMPPSRADGGCPSSATGPAAIAGASMILDAAPSFIYPSPRWAVPFAGAAFRELLVAVGVKLRSFTGGASPSYSRAALAGMSSGCRRIAVRSDGGLVGDEWNTRTFVCYGLCGCMGSAVHDFGYSCCYIVRKSPACVALRRRRRHRMLVVLLGDDVMWMMCAVQTAIKLHIVYSQLIVWILKAACRLVGNTTLIIFFPCASGFVYCILVNGIQLLYVVYY